LLLLPPPLVLALRCVMLEVTVMHGGVCDGEYAA
jgi:hypothetical protein